MTARGARLPGAGVLAVAAALLLIIAASIAVEHPGLTWMNGYGVAPDQTFNMDDIRFVRAAQNFEGAARHMGGYPIFMVTQLFVLMVAAHKLLGVHLVLPTALRAISLAWAQVAIVLTYRLGRRVGLNAPGALCAAFLLAIAPQFVLLATQGTPDISVLALFYAAVLAGMAARRSGSSGWCHAACALAGVAMADKFLLPVLVLPAMLILLPWRPGVVERALLAGLIGIASFGVASFFNYTPFDLARLMRMLAYDNVVVAGRIAPPGQLLRYLWDVPSTAGVVTALLAAAAIVRAAAMLRRPPAGDRDGRTIAAKAWTLLEGERALLVLPLAAHAVLIVGAGVHFTRHLLIFVPVLAILAAATIERLVAFRSSAARVAAGALVAAVLLAGLYNAHLIALLYPQDLRRAVVARLQSDPAMKDAETLSFYTKLRGVRRIDTLPDAPTFVSCDLEYGRYLRGRDTRAVFHPFGGQRRLAFFRALFAGQTGYRPVVRFDRRRGALEDRLSATGAIPSLDTNLPSRCLIFERLAPTSAIQPRPAEGTSQGA